MLNLGALFGWSTRQILSAELLVLISDEAVLQLRFLNRREDRRWIDNPEWMALFLAALTELTLGTLVDVEMVTGLPIAFYSDKSQIQQRLLGEHRAQREGRRGVCPRG